MTKLKNTKKGMAKKALSISLVAAMLATSNVPVWAAEFGDGTDVAPVIVEEAPAEVDLFSDAAEETPVDDVAPVADAAPTVVEETPDKEAPVQASSSVYDDSVLSKFTTGEWGKKIKLPEDSIVYTDDKDSYLGTINAFWTYKGVQVGNAYTSGEYEGLNTNIWEVINDNAPAPSKAECIEGGDWGLVVRIYVNGEINFSKSYNFGPAQAVDLTNALEKNNAAEIIKFDNQTYSGKENKPVAKLASGNYIYKVQRGDKDEIGIDDFAWDYVRTINGSNDLISADKKVNNEKIDVIAKVTAPGYTGTLTKTDAFTVAQKNLKTAESKGELDINLTKKAYEFTGDTIQFVSSDATFVDTATGDDLTSYIASVTTSSDGWVGEGKTSTITMNLTKDSGVGLNYTSGNPNSFAVEDSFAVIKRDLSKCSIKLDGDYQAGELDAKIAADKDDAFTWGKNIRIYDADGKELGKTGVLYKLLSNKVIKNKDTGVYSVVIKGSGSADGHKADTQVTETLTQEISSPDLTLRDYKVFLNSNGKRGTLISKDNIQREYTQEAYILDEDDIILYDQKTDRQLTGESRLFTVECDQTTNAGVHWIKIHGTGSYTGSTLTVYYTVKQATYSKHSLNKKVVINNSYTKASDYADAIGLTVNAVNGATPAKSFTLKPEDMDVTYTFGNIADKNGNKNAAHNTITVKATITNKDFLAVYNGGAKKTVSNSDGTKTTIETVNGKVVITETVKIVHPSIADATVKFMNDDYSFTGKEIIPDIQVIASNGAILKEGVDYRLDVKHGLHAGQAEVVVEAIKNCNTPDSDTLYEKGTTNEHNYFTIKPADISKVTATGEFTYNGAAQTPTVSQLGLKLNKVDVSSYFNGTYPKDFKNNVNAGTATVTLTVKDQWKDDFSALSADVAFTIKPLTITSDAYYEGIFTVYAENGHVIDFRAFEGFNYDGTAKTFKDAKYENRKIVVNGKTLEKGKDYTIEYADNVNPDKTGKDGKTAVVYAKLSSNFILDTVGKWNQKQDRWDVEPIWEGDCTITTQNGEKITNVVGYENYRISKASVANAVVSVSTPVYSLGNEVTPNVTVNVNGKDLEEGRDYELVFSKNNTYEAGAKNTVTVKGVGGYVASEQLASWTVAPKELDSEDITVIFDKKAYKPGEAPTVTVLDGQTVVDPSEYTVAYDTEEGIATITSTGKNYSGAREDKYDVTARGDLANAIVTVEDAKETGAQVTPAVTVQYGNIILEEGKDYTVSYGENIEGTGTVTITAVEGSVDYKGTQTVEFNIISKVDLADVTVTVADAKETGAQVTPAVVVRNGRVVLEEGKDYTVSYGENIEGTGTVTITAVEGNADYKGSQTVEFEIISKKTLADVTVSKIADVEATGEQITPAVTVKDGNKILEEGTDYTVSYGENIEVGIGTVTITAVEGNADYKGSQTVEFNIVEKAPEVGQPMITDVEMIYNRAHVTLAGDVDGAEGYDYVIATENDYVTGRVAINKNRVATSTDFLYVQKGVYYAYCHAWKRVDGKKVFGDWSNAFKFEVATTTPDQPVITSVTRNGSDVTVTFTSAENAIGYDVVLGTRIGNVYGEKRPVEYGELVKKGIKNGKTSVTFKDVPAGTYYAGLHAFNRSAADNKKVFSPWSNSVRVIVK